VLQAGNGLEALAVADQHSGKIDIVVTDVVMPRMGGPELVEKATTKTPRICSHFYARTSPTFFFALRDRSSPVTSFLNVFSST
jgi:CheY-like chemotaxis protein